MAVYTTLGEVQQMLQAAPDVVWSDDDAALITSAIATVSHIIDLKTGMTFGATPVEETILVEGEGGPYLFLPKKIRTVSGIVESPTWDGTAWNGGYAIGTSEWRYGVYDAQNLTYYLLRENGGWGSFYAITGQWGDQPIDDEIPEPIKYVATYIVAELYKKRQANPAGFQGPNGYTVPIRNAFAEPEVKMILGAYRSDPMVSVI